MAGSKPEPESAPCTFCEIVSGQRDAHAVFEDDTCVGILDHRPLFPGHVLLLPRAHHETLADLPAELLQPVFANAQLLARAVETAMAAQGTFVAMNNRVSQSVRHLHVHIVPRSKGDGLRGFFWPRRGYSGVEHAGAVRDSIRREVARVVSSRRQ